MSITGSTENISADRKAMGKFEFDELLSVQDRHWWHNGKRRILDKIIRKRIINNLNSNLKSKLDILEIGSGTGANLPVLSRYGHVTAMEFDDYARSLIKPSENIEVKAGYLPDGLDEIRGRDFDLICLFDVLEHIEDDGASLDIINNYLRPDGKFFMTVPAYQWLYSVHDKVMGHYRRYTKTQVKNLCEKHDFKILYCGYMNSLLFPLMVAARLFDKYVVTGGGGSSSTGIGILPFGLNSLFDKIFYLESLYIPYIEFPFGGSVIALCEKSLK